MVIPSSAREKFLMLGENLLSQISGNCALCGSSVLMQSNRSLSCDTKGFLCVPFPLASDFKIIIFS